MLSQLVQEMRVGSHIPYRKSECGWPGLLPLAGDVRVEAAPKDSAERPQEEVRGPFW